MWRAKRRSARRIDHAPNRTRGLLAGTALLHAPAFSPRTAAPVPPIRFREVAAAAGFPSCWRIIPPTDKHLIETMPGGIAVFDYDGDGRPDIYFTNGADIPSLEKSSPKYWNRLFRNEGNLKFTRCHRTGGRRRRGLLHGRRRRRLR